MNRPGPAAPQQMVKAFPLGDSGFALVGGGVAVDINAETNELVVAVVAVGGRISEIVGLTPIQVPVHELARIPIADVVKALAEKEQADTAGALSAMPRADG